MKKLDKNQEKLLLIAILFGVGSFAILLLTSFKKGAGKAAALGSGATGTGASTTAGSITAPARSLTPAAATLTPTVQATTNPYAGWQIDPQTGYSISPNTGNLLDLTTGNIYDPNSGAYLGNINSTVDNTGLNGDDNYSGGSSDDSSGGGGGTYPTPTTTTPVTTPGAYIQPYYNQLGQYVDTYHNNPNNPNYNLGAQPLIVQGRNGSSDVLASVINGQAAAGSNTNGTSPAPFLTTGILASLGIGGSSVGSTGPKTTSTSSGTTQAPTGGTTTGTTTNNAPTQQPTNATRGFSGGGGGHFNMPSGAVVVGHVGTPGTRHDCGCNGKK